MTRHAAWALALALTTSGTALAQGPSAASFSYGGRLANGDVAVKGPVDLELRFFRTASGGSPVLSAPLVFSGVQLVDGIFQLDVAMTASEAAAVLDSGQPTWIEVRDVTNATSYPRQRMAAMPFALRVPVDGTTIAFDSLGKLTAVGAAGGTVGAHTHSVSEVTGLQAALDGKASSSHGHSIGQVTGLQAALDGKAATAHTHAIADTTGLQTALDGKAAATHSHTLAGDVTGDVGTTQVVKLRGVAVSSTLPTTTGQVLKWDGNEWAPGPDDGGVAGTITGGQNLGVGGAGYADVYESTAAPNMKFRRLQQGTGVELVQGADAITVALSSSASSAVATASAATDANTASTLVKRDAIGNFAAGTITASLVGNVTGNVSGTAGGFSGSLSGDVTGSQSSTTVAQVGGVTAANVASAANAVTTATHANTPSKLVIRDASGNFAAGTITASLNGNATGFTGSLGGDVTGAQSTTTVTKIRGRTVSTIAPVSGDTLVWDNALSEWKPTKILPAINQSLSAPAGAITIGTNGYLGVGIAPSSPLMVTGTSSSVPSAAFINDASAGSNGQPVLSIAASHDGAILGSGPRLDFRAAADTMPLARIRSSAVSSSAAALAFDTGTSGSLSTKMVIDPNGKIGIGTNSPASNLHIVSAAHADIMVKASGAGNPALVRLEDGSGGLFDLLSTPTGGGVFEIRRNNVLQFQIDSAGTTKVSGAFAPQGAMYANIKTVSTTGNYTVVATDHVLKVTVSGVTIVLPGCAGPMLGRTLVILASGTTVGVSPSSIPNLGSSVNAGNAATVLCDGAAWYAL